VNRILMVCMCLWLSACGAPEPTESELIEHFEVHQTRYEAVVALFLETGWLRRVEISENNSGQIVVFAGVNQLDQESEELLRGFFRSSGVEVIDAGRESGEISLIRFHVYRYGIAPSGLLMGLEFRNSDGRQSLNMGASEFDCDDQHPSPERVQIENQNSNFSCRINDNWFVYSAR
jgi:hypothetical protein